MSYVGAATNVVGGALQMAAAIQARNAMAKAYDEEMARQRGYATQAMGQFNQAAMGSGVEEARRQLGIGEQSRLGDYLRVGGVNMGLGQPNRSTMALDLLYRQQRGGERAKLGAYSDYSLASAIQQMRNQQGLDQISNFAKGTAGVFPYRMYDAQHSADKLAMIGQMISSIGGGAGNWAQFAQGPQGGGVGPGGVQNWGSMSPGQQQDYWQQYWYYNSPQSPGFVPAGRYE